MDDANEFVRVIEKRTGKKISCVEEIAYLHGFIDKNKLMESIEKYGNSGYGLYLKNILKNDR